MPFSPEQLDRIPHILSEPRFTTYLRHCDGNRQEALRLYQWNLEISAAFISPLHVLEVSIRNAIVEVLEQVHTSNWAWNQGFLRSLPNPPQGYNPTENLYQIARQQETIGKVVAELKFIFWEKMFTARHDKRLWNQYLKQQFPFSPADLTAKDLRKALYDDIHHIRRLRNRIAHHEPIFSRDLQDDYNRIHRLIYWRSDITASWLDELQHVTGLIEPYRPMQ